MVDDEIINDRREKGENMTTETLIVCAGGVTYAQLRENAMTKASELTGDTGVTDEETFEPGMRLWRLESVYARHENDSFNSEVVFSLRTGRLPQQGG